MGYKVASSGKSSFSNTLRELNASGLTIGSGGFKFNIPSLNVIMGGSGSSNSIVMSAGSLVQTMTAGARGVFCIGAIIGDSALALSTLKKCFDYIMMTGLSLLNDIYKVCIARLNDILKTVYGITLSIFSTIKNVIGAINGIIDLVEKIYKAIKNASKLDLGKLFDKENCDFFIANLFRCMMGKLVDPYIQKFKTNVTQKINDYTANIPDKISQTVEPVTSMSTFVDNQAMFVNKFTNQVGNLF